MASRQRRTSLASGEAVRAERSVCRSRPLPATVKDTRVARPPPPPPSAPGSLTVVPPNMQTRVAQEVLKSLGVPWVLVVSQDNFYKTLSPEESAAARASNHGVLFFSSLLGALAAKDLLSLTALRCLFAPGPGARRFRLARLVRLRQARRMRARHEGVQIGPDPELLVRGASAHERVDVPLRRQRDHRQARAVPTWSF